MSGLQEKKNGWLVTNGFLKSPKFDELAGIFLEEAGKLSIALELKKNTDFMPGYLDIAPDSQPDFVLFWDKDILLARYLEQRGIPVFNSSQAIEVCDDKRLTFLALSEKNLPIPDTVIAPMTYRNIGFTELDFLKSVSERLAFPLIVKEAFGSFGEQVYLAGDFHELESIVKKCGSVELLFQAFISNSKGRDLRLQVVGDQVVGAMERYSDHDFRANITAGGHMRKYEPSKEECRLAVAAAKAVGADFAGVDLLFGKEGPLVCEVNSNAHFKNLYDCSGVNTAEYILRYILEGKQWMHG